MNAEHRRWQEDVAAYALDALDADERRAVEDHLAGCERCRADLRWLEPAVDVLGESVPQLTPPPGLRERLLSTTSAEARAPERSGWRRRRRGWALRPATALAVVAIAAVAGVAGYALRGADETTEPSTQVALVRDGDAGTLRVSNLPRIDEGVYQVWIQHGDRVSPSSAFVPGPDGTGEATIPSDLAGADAVMVTHEPERGREHPSAPPLITTELE